MIKERIQEQLRNIKELSVIKALEIIALADTLEVKILVKKLKNKISDVDFILKKIEDEFHINIKGEVIEGLHPIRSRHILDEINRNNISETDLIRLLDLVSESEIPKIASQLPLKKIDNIEEFYSKFIETNKLKTYSFHLEILNGLLRGEAKKYYLENINFFNESNEKKVFYY